MNSVGIHKEAPWVLIHQILLPDAASITVFSSKAL
jgi:hypothetical protein